MLADYFSSSQMEESVEFKNEVRMYVYMTEDSGGQKKFRFRTRGKILSTSDESSISDLAKRARSFAWSTKKLNVKWDLDIILRPLADIDWGAYYKDPVKCFPLSEADAHLFWTIFSRSEEEANRIRGIVEGAMAHKK